MNESNNSELEIIGAHLTEFTAYAIYTPTQMDLEKNASHQSTVSPFMHTFCN